ncbi:MAG: hypothetical protein WA816_12740 [Bacteroidales bacterium]
MKKLLIFCFTMILLVISCKKIDDQIIRKPSDNLVSKNMLINNDLNSLNDRIYFTGDTNKYVIKDTLNAISKSSEGKMNSSTTVQLIAVLLPPRYKEEVLQASHIRIVDNYAYIAYNTQGPRYLGGVDIVDINSPIHPKLISSVVFINEATNKGKDVSSIDVKNSPSAKCNTTLWITGADETSDSAFVERYELNTSHQFDSTRALNFYLKGYVGTDVRYYNDKVYVTSGTDGGLTILDDQMKEVSYLDLKNARSVDINKDFNIVLGGNPGHLFNPGFWDEEIGGANDPEAKSIIRLSCKFALAALGEEGLKCYNIASDTPSALISSLPRPSVPEGKNSWDYVTNGVSVFDNGRVYVANGAGGLDIAKIDNNGLLKRLGNIYLGASANFVEANANYIFVATGTGGLEILKVTEN